MKIEHKSIKGVALISFPCFEDDRGSFTPLFNSTILERMPRGLKYAYLIFEYGLSLDSGHRLILGTE